MEKDVSSFYPRLGIWPVVNDHFETEFIEICFLHFFGKWKIIGRFSERYWIQWFLFKRWDNNLWIVKYKINSVQIWIKIIFIVKKNEKFKKIHKNHENWQKF